MQRVTKGRGARCKAISPGDHSGKTAVQSPELEHVPNCDTMQERATVVKPTGRKDRRQALGLVQVQMFSGSVLVTDMIVRQFANIVDVSPEIKILIKHNTEIFLAVFDG